MGKQPIQRQVAHTTDRKHRQQGHLSLQQGQVTHMGR